MKPILGVLEAMQAKKVVFISGASSGIGEALAKEFASLGYAVAIGARRVNELDRVVSEIVGSGGDAFGIYCDVCKASSMADAVQSVVDRYKRIDIAIANAGFGVVGKLEALSDEDYQRQFETNVFGVIRFARATIPHLKLSQGQLAIVGSVNGFVSLPGNSPYGMSKFAVRALADSLRGELRESQIGVSYIAPGFVSSQIRSVNNYGVFKKQAHDPIPQWLVMPSNVAARKIARGLLKRRSEIVITIHGKLVVFLSRHFSWLLGWVLSSGVLRARKQPKD